jgi:hypothetical protein
MTSRYAQLRQGELATLLPELLLIGFWIDRAGMPWCTMEFGRETMERVAIEEWVVASPIYAKRIQKALDFEGDDVATIFKAMQFDIGAPPQLMDFRYALHDNYHGQFWLDHCGALVDLEPMGDDYVHGMCHTIEDPTFDATAIATNRRAQMRPIHRPPRVPTERHPHCAWTVTIEDDYPEVADPPGLEAMRRTRIARLELGPIDRSESGKGEYSGDLVSDVDFREFSHSALIRLADEIVVEMHLLALGYYRALQQRCDPEKARSMFTAQLIGFSAFAAERLRDALGVTADVSGAMRVLEMHPLINPAAYVSATAANDLLTVARSPAHDDCAWISLVGPDEFRPLQAIVRAVSPTLDVEVTGDDDRWTARITDGHASVPESREVAMAKFGSGSAWRFEQRRSLPLMVL